MYIVETSYELEEFADFIKGKVSYWFPMWSDIDLHPLNNTLSFIFVRCDEMDYILSHNHIDTLSIDLEGIGEVISNEGIRWVFQKKKLLHTLKINPNGLLDIDTAYFLKSGETIDYKTPFQHIFSHWRNNGYYDNLTKIIPILKLCEVIQSIIPKYQNLTNDDYNFSWYNDEYLPILRDIEQMGVRVDGKKFLDRWPHAHKQISQSNTVYTEYNPFTSTGRPSNRYGGINFSALNKTDGSRECFIPTDGKIFLQMDYDGYHIRLIGKLIGFPLPKTSVHQWLGEQYGVSYEESKGVTFQLLYGGIPDEFLSIPFYSEVKEYIDKLWEETNRLGYLKTLKRRIPLGWIENPNPQKVFNYLIQAVETELNVEKLKRIIKTIEGSGIGLNLYVYDSFLFEVPLEVDKENIIQLKEIIESGGFPIKGSWGMDYSKV
jgi:hypothetical protein